VWTSSRFAAIYILWIFVCAILFVALRGTQDPSRRSDRIVSNDAGLKALAILKARDSAKYSEYEAVHVAYARAGEGAPERRWVVLCDRVPHTALREAVVVELRADDGNLLRIRKPVD
jgi:hypothetical protein